MTVCECVPSPSGGVQFCSATYRLFKVGPSEQCRDTDTVMEVQYKGRWGERSMVGGRRGEGIVCVQGHSYLSWVGGRMVGG